MTKGLFILGAIINIFGSLSYLISTLKGKTKPDKITWFIWALAPMVAFSAQIKQGVGLLSLPTFMAGFNPALIFLASFVNKKAQWKLGKLDITCGVLAVLGLLLWQITKSPNLALLFAILADGLAALPTVVKSFTNPETENHWAFLVVIISSTIALSTIKVWNLAHYAFIVYSLAVCALLFFLIRFKLGPKIQKTFR